MLSRVKLWADAVVQNFHEAAQTVIGERQRRDGEDDEGTDPAVGTVRYTCMPLPKLIGVPTIALLLEALDKERESHGPTILGLSQFERSDHNLRHTMDRHHETPTIVGSRQVKSVETHD